MYIMEWQKIYEQKFMEIKDAVRLIANGDVLWAGAYCNNPVQMLDALADRRDELDHVDIVHAMACVPHRYLAGDFKGHLNSHTFFMGPVERQFFGEGNITVNSVNYSQTGPCLEHFYHVNTLFVEVSEPDEDGNMYFGPIGVAWDGRVAGFARKKIVQINKYQGKVRGKDCCIHVSDVDAICRFDHPLTELEQKPVSAVDKQIASYIVPRIPDGCTLQIGLGGISNAVAYSLIHHKHIGIHTEMLTDSMVYLYNKGVIDADRVLAGFGMGSQAVYDWCHSGIPELADISYVNRAEIAGAKEHFISINSCLMVDLTGQVGSESIGCRQFSCTGGQLDYVEAAGISEGGQSYLCLKSTVQHKDGTKASTITCTLPVGQAVTTPRSKVMYIVTEYGLADLYNKPLKERAKALIAIAHPDFRESLTQQAREVGLLSTED
jgi:acyl-CoA hydrolase